MTYIDFKAINNVAPGAKWRLQDDTYETLEWLSDDIPKPSLETLVAETQKIKSEIPWKRLRSQRDKLLSETDWTVTRAVEKSTDGFGVQLEQVWVDYRQALRDLPANTDDPENPVWPIKP